MKICFLISNINHSGGTERVTCILANQLIQLNYQVSIASLAGEGKPYFDFNEYIQIQYLYAQKPSFTKNFLGCVYKIRSFVYRENIDVLIDVDSILTVFSVPALIGMEIKHICWEHFNFEENLGVRFRNWGRQLAVRYCDQIITLTEKDKVLWQKGIKNIHAKINAISNPTPYENIESFPKFENKTALALGRLTYQKSFDLLLKAWVNVNEKYPDWKLQIIGSGEEENQLKTLCNTLGIEKVVEFIPVTQNVIQYYKDASVYCMSSRFEGLPMVLLEAQAFGLPVVAFDCNTGPSDLIQPGENGYLVPCFDTTLFAQAIMQVIELDETSYRLMCEKAKVKNSEFYCDKIINKWIEVIGN